MCATKQKKAAAAPIGIKEKLLAAGVKLVIEKGFNKISVEDITKTADILVSAIGKPKFFTKDYVKDNAVIVDVGINRHEDGKIVGDFDFDNVKDKASFITPVPKGVGPMTIAMLMSNTLELYKRHRGIK